MVAAQSNSLVLDPINPRLSIANMIADGLDPDVGIPEDELEELNLARTRMRYFIPFTFPQYKADLFHLTVCDSIDRIVSGDLTHLMLFAPPQTGKSEIVSTRLPGYWLAHHPDLPVLLTSYGDGLALRNSRNSMAVVESPQYERLFRPWGIMPDKDHWRIKDWHLLGQKGKVIPAGMGGRVTGEGFGLCIVDDPIKDYAEAQSELIREKLWDWWRGTLITRLWENHRIVFMMCMPGDTRIMMENGSWLPLQEICQGDRVITWSNGTQISKNVEAVSSLGSSKILAIRTGNHLVRATPNHPFLIKKDLEFLYIRADQLNIGDELVCLGSWRGSENNRGLDEDDLWVLGYMYGDGWITKHPNKDQSMRWATCVAAGVYEDRNERIISYFEREFDVRPKLTKGGYFRTEVAAIGKYFESLGFGGTSKTKRVAEWLFALPVNLRVAFLNGYSDADGSIDEHNRVNIVSANHDLAMDIKLLATSCGYRVTNLSKTERQYKPPSSRKAVWGTSYRISWNPNKIDPNQFSVKRITSIEDGGEEEVFDLTIQDTHNFVAEGLVVHNTRWHEDDLAARVLKNDGNLNVCKDCNYYMPNDKKPEKCPKCGGERGMWKILSFAALAEPQEERDIGNKSIGLPDGLPDQLGRKIEKSVAPSRFTAKFYNELKFKVGDLVWNAEYQQHPAPPKGDMFKVGRIEIVDAYPIESFGGQLIDQAPAGSKRKDLIPVGVKRCIRFWDLAATEQTDPGDPDWTIGALEGLEKDTNLTWALNMVRVRGSPENVQEIVKQTAAIDGKRVKIRIEQEPGAAGKKVINDYKRVLVGYDVEGVPATGEKQVRATPLSIQVNAGNMRMLEAEWNAPTMATLRVFPHGKHDDDVDAMSGSFNELTEPSDFHGIKFKHLKTRRPRAN